MQTVMNELNCPCPVYESICFHSQQTAEKYLKGYLVWLDIEFRKTHEIGELIQQCSQSDPEISEFIEKADILTDYAVEIRYPDHFWEPTAKDAREAYDIAVKVKDYIKNKTNL